jgi:hypothetical protein
VAEKSNRMPCGITVPNQPASFTTFQIIKMSLASQFDQFASDNLSINYRAGINLDATLFLFARPWGLSLCHGSETPRRDQQCRMSDRKSRKRGSGWNDHAR